VADGSIATCESRRDDDGRRQFVVLPSPLVKIGVVVLAGLLLAATIGGFGAWVSFKGFEREWATYRSDIRANNEFRLQGDRVTPADVDAIKAWAEALVERQDESLNALAETFRGLNETIVDLAIQFGALRADVEAVRREQDRARQQGTRP
jgi:hypothetical protein